MILAIAAATFVSTMLGGLFALRLRDKLHLILGFSAGAVIAVAFFDLLPEALAAGVGYSIPTILSVTACGFLIYLTLDRFLVLHGHDDEGHHNSGAVGASALSFHSLLDGIGIGLAFQLSPMTGVVVAVAVLVHDFSDGINTVSMIVRTNGARSVALRWLTIDALAPVAGIALGSLITVSQGVLGLLLALFAGFFIYIGASDLIPESHHAHPTFLTTIMTLVGAGVLFFAIKLAGL